MNTEGEKPGKMLETTIKCVKYLLFIFNLLFAISGLALIITGGVIQGKYSEYLDFLGHDFFNVPVLLIVVGCVIFFITFFGCCGAVKENHCMTMTFSVLLAMIFIIEIGAGIAAYTLRGKLHTVIETNMEKGLLNYGKKTASGVTGTWNIVQHELKCCGAQEYKDWVNATFSEKDDAVPDSCCKDDIEGCGKGVLKMDDAGAAAKVHTTGCLGKLESLVADNVATVGAVGVGIAIIQIIGVIFACCLARNIKSQYETV